jgi:hypothetical protein
MPVRAEAFVGAFLCCSVLLPIGVHAEGIDTEHLFGFIIGSDVGTFGEREFQSETTGRFSRAGGRYRALGQELELEFLPARDFRVELGSTFTAHDINGVTGFEDTRRLAWQGISVDLRYKLLDRDAAPFGLTFAVTNHAERVDETTAALVRKYGTEWTLALDRELIPGLSVVALNLTYQPEWTRFLASGQAEQESTIGAGIGMMAQVRPGFLVGGEARYLRRYEGIGLDAFAGHALFIGPTAYLQLSERSRLTAAWSFQAWGRPAGPTSALDLINFERHQAKLIFGFNF